VILATEKDIKEASRSSTRAVSLNVDDKAGDAVSEIKETEALGNDAEAATPRRHKIRQRPPLRGSHEGASDIHIEPEENGVLRMRLTDGLRSLRRRQENSIRRCVKDKDHG